MIVIILSDFLQNSKFRKQIEIQKSTLIGTLFLIL